MPPCELCEIEISALLDGESPQEALLPLVDHLAECARCRDFYQRARRLDEAVASWREPLAGAPPPELWPAIERSSGLAARRALPRWSTRISQIAAAVLLAFGLWAAIDRQPATNDDFEVVLGQDAGRMSDERFARMVVDLLSADRRYHRKMLEVITAVEQISGQGENPEPILPTFAHQELDEREPKSWTF